MVFEQQGVASRTDVPPELPSVVAAAAVVLARLKLTRVHVQIRVARNLTEEWGTVDCSVTELVTPGLVMPILHFPSSLAGVPLSEFVPLFGSGCLRRCP